MTTDLPLRDELARLLYTPVVSDVLDSFGLRQQALRPFVRPLDETLVLFGRARTGRYAPASLPAAGHNPHELEMDLIDSLRPGEVAVLACGGPTDVIAPWGELLSTAARARRSAGCVTDGLVRDVPHAGEEIKRDAPVCTLISATASVPELIDRGARLLSELPDATLVSG